VYDTNHRRATSYQYPLRPGKMCCWHCEACLNIVFIEFIESTWYLYRVSYRVSSVLQLLILRKATKDPFYLDVGERVLLDLITRAKVDCGLAGIQDLRTNKRDDRMESFALSETLKVGRFERICGLKAEIHI
jgi:ER degradation enhancer, mannosidase alpha-like 1